MRGHPRRRAWSTSRCSPAIQHDDDRRAPACCAARPAWPRRPTSWPRSADKAARAPEHRGLGGHQPAHGRHRPASRPRACARRPVARTGARTSPTATTSTGSATSTSRVLDADRPDVATSQHWSRRTPVHLVCRRRCSTSSTAAGLDPSTTCYDVVVARLGRGPARAAQRRHQRPHRSRSSRRRGRLGAPAPTASSPGSAVAAARLPPRVGPDVERHAAACRTAPGCERGDVLLTRRGPDPRAAHRRAHRAELPLPPVRRRHRDRAPGSTRWPAPGRGCATPARRCPACRRWRSTPCAAAAGVNHRIVAVRRGADQGQPRAGRRRCGRRRTDAVRARYPDLPVEVEVDHAGPAARACSTPARSRSCSTT